MQNSLKSFVKRAKYSTYFKIFLSYLVLVCITVSIIGAALFNIFLKQYKEKVIDVNNQILKHNKQIIEVSILEKISILYYSLGSIDTNNIFVDPTYFLHNSKTPNSSLLFDYYSQLKTFVNSNHELIEAIHIYMPNNNIVISSTWGVQFLNDNSKITNNNLDWFKYEPNSVLQGKWIGTEPMNEFYHLSNTKNVLTFIRTFPLFPNRGPARGLIVINLNEKTLGDHLLKSSQVTNSVSLLVDNEGSIIAATDNSIIKKQTKRLEFIEAVLKKQKSSGNFIHNYKDSKHMVSFNSFEKTGWIIMSLISVEDYFNQTKGIIRFSCIAFIIALIIGIYLAYFFSKLTYSPIKSLKNNIIKLNPENFKLQDIENSHKDYCDEYSFMGNYIDKLALNLDSLKQRILDYKPILKSYFIISLINNAFPNEKELLSLRDMSEISFPNKYYNCMLIQMNIQNCNLPEKKYLGDSIISSIENMTSLDINFQGAVLSKKILVIIINTNSKDEKIIKKTIGKLQSYTTSEFNTTFICSLGCWTDNYLNLYLSFNEARKAMSCKFYYPEEFFLSYSSLFDNCNPANTDLDIKEFISQINLQNIYKIKNYLDNLLHYLRAGKFNVEYRDHQLVLLINAFAKHCKKLNLNNEIGLKNLIEESKQITDIYQYRHWVINKINLFFEILDNKKNTKNEELIKKAELYIKNNIGCQISLDSAAEYVGLAPKYFSSIFKKVTGTTFQEYLINLRLIEARNLLLNSDLNISEISEEIGYFSVSYFIKQFKKVYGKTPNAYRNSSHRFL